MIKEASKFMSSVREASRILIVAHKNPDGDAVGASLALKYFLDEQKKKAALLCIDSVPKNLYFLDGVNEFTGKVGDFSLFGLVITIDCSCLSQTGFQDQLENFKNKIMNIDHHATNDNFGKINIVDKNASATAEIVFDIFHYLKVKIDAKKANALLTGIFTDTGSFRFPNTSAKTLKIASELVRKGAYLPKIAKSTFRINSLPTLKVWGKVLSKVEINGLLKMAVSAVSFKELKETKTSTQDLTGVASIINTVKGTRLALLLTQIDSNHVKGNLRTTEDAGIDVSKFAGKFGGGGHRLAAGFTVEGKLVKTKEGWTVE